MRSVPVCHIGVLCVLVFALGMSRARAEPPVQQDPASGAIQGRVVLGTRPVKGATVEIREAGDDRVIGRVATDENGSFGPFALREGTYDLEIHPRWTRRPPMEGDALLLGYRALWNVGVIAGETHRLPPIDLRRADASYRKLSRGTVRDSRHRPVAGAAVAVWEQDIHFGRPGDPARIHTDSSGRYAIAARGRWVWLQAESAGNRSPPRYAPPGVLDLEITSGPVSSRGVRPIDWTIRRTVTRDAPSGTLAGAVHSPSPGPFEIALLREEERVHPPPVHAAAALFSGGHCLDCVELPLPWEIYAFAGSRFVLPHVPAGMIHVRVRQGGRVAIVSGVIGSGTTASLEVRVTGSSSTHARFLRPSGRPLISGTVCVTLPEFPDEPLNCAETDADGEVRLDGLTSGTRDLRVLYAKPMRVEIGDGQQVDLGTVRLDQMDDEHEPGR